MDVEIKNEAGTEVIATGRTDNFQNEEFTVTEINNPGVIHRHSEYQVHPAQGNAVGVICTAKQGTTANFKK